MRHANLSLLTFNEFRYGLVPFHSIRVTPAMSERILIIDLGFQAAPLIVRRVREAGTIEWERSQRSVPVP